MEVKGQLIEAQAEVVSDNSKSKVGQLSYDKTRNQPVFGNGTEGRYFQDGFLGEVKQAFITEAQVQAEWGSGWILCDGRSVVGSDYQAEYGESNVPDLRGVFFRGKNNGRSDGNENPAGDQALGTYESDQANTVEQFSAGVVPGSPLQGSTTIPLDGSTSEERLSGGFDGGDCAVTMTKFGYDEEARPKSVTGNYFIKINR